MKIELTGSRKDDKALANKAAGVSLPPGYVWHHSERLGVMEPLKNLSMEALSTVAARNYGPYFMDEHLTEIDYMISNSRFKRLRLHDLIGKKIGITTDSIDNGLTGDCEGESFGSVCITYCLWQSERPSDTSEIRFEGFDHLSSTELEHAFSVLDLPFSYKDGFAEVVKAVGETFKYWERTDDAVMCLFSFTGNEFSYKLVSRFERNEMVSLFLAREEAVKPNVVE